MSYVSADTISIPSVTTLNCKWTFDDITFLYLIRSLTIYVLVYVHQNNVWYKMLHFTLHSHSIVYFNFV